MTRAYSIINISLFKIKWSFTNVLSCITKVGDGLRDTKFILCTDHKNLTYVDKDPRPRVQRWKLAMQEFDFQIIHIPGKENIVADGLSRHCHEQRKEELLRTTYEESLLTIQEETTPEGHVTNAHWKCLKKVHSDLVGHHRRKSGVFPLLI